MIAEPPLLAGATHETVILALPRRTSRFVGTPGTVAGVTEADGLEATLSLTAFVAFTVNVYATPLVRPVTMQLVVAEVQVFVTAPTCGEAETVYPVIAEPFDAGAVQDTVT